MKNQIYLTVIFLTGCGGFHATYLENVPANTTLARPLYNVSVPQDSAQDKRKWERYSKDGNSDDLILKYSEGYPLPSYAASIEVKRGQKNINATNDLIGLVKTDTNFMKYTTSSAIETYRTTQPSLICVQPPFHNDSAPDRPYAMFWYKLNCIDLKTHNYYELNISYMSNRKSATTPPSSLLPMAEHFFRSFMINDD